MDIPLSYYPILHMSSVKPCGMAVLKKAGHSTQKFALIGGDGVLHMYRYDNKTLNLRFKAPEGSGKSEAIFSSGDVIFSSFGNSVKTYNRKGLEAKFKDSPFENGVTHIYVGPKEIVYIASISLFTQLNSSYQPVTLSAPIVGITYFGSLIYMGCTDGTVNSYIAGGTQLVHRLPSAVTYITTITRKANQTFLVVACSNSQIYFFDANDKQTASFNLNSPATAIAAYDFDKDGFSELLVALEDSTVSLISVSLLDNPKVLASLQLGFNVSNIAIGMIYSSDMATAIVASQTGQVGLLCVEPRSDRSLLTGKAPKVTEQEIEQLKQAVAELETRSKTSNVKHMTIPAQTNVDIRGDTQSQRFIFITESERPIARVALSSTIPLKYHARSDCQTIISICPPKEHSHSVVIRPIDASATRLAFDFSYEIGQGGELKCFVSFVKNASVLQKSFTLKPFGLLKKVNDDSLDSVSDDALGILEVSASHASSAFRDLLDNCLPTTIEDDEKQTFASGPIGALVSVVIHQDKFIAKSIFFPIVVQLRNFILESMNKAKQRVSFETKLGDRCITTFFKLIQNRLFEVMQAGALFVKLQALQEVRNSSPGSSFGDEESQRILADAVDIERKFEECREEYDAYLQEIKIFYVEMWKRNNMDASANVNMLMDAVKEVKDDESLNNLIEFMKTTPK